MDNGRQFNSASFKDFCEGMGTELCFTSVHHLQSNGVLERANGNIISAHDKRLVDIPRGTCADELPTVLWGHRTSVSRATGFTPFKLLFRDEAMNPAEIKGKCL